MAILCAQDITLECLQGDIVDQADMEAIVNAANARLLQGEGVAGAIHRAAGPGLEKECRPLAPIQPGDAVITGGHNLPNKHVIHCLGPVYGKDEPADIFLASCYCNTLRVAEEHGIRSVAFPAVSTGIFGYPVEEAAQIALDTVFNKLPHLSTVNHIRFVLFSKADLNLYERLFGKSNI